MGPMHAGNNGRGHENAHNHWLRHFAPPSLQ
jgi:hypothetical protein